jgi:4-amino-4-deoxy-L-arabinose transferase-like glycosyltransferase
MQAPAGSRSFWLAPETRAVLAVVVAGVAVRLLVARLVGLTVDESYAVAMSRQLDWSYYDHPPAMFWLAGLATRLAQGEDVVAVRVPFILLFAATTWLMYLLGAHLFGRAAGLWAALLLNLSLFFSVAAGGWVLPDGPLLAFGTGAALCLAAATLPGSGGEGRALTPGDPAHRACWIGFGALAGLALLSKYHAVFLLGGAALFLLTVPAQRPWLRRQEPWLALASVVLVFVPVLAWNLSRGFVSFRFQLGRAVPVEDHGTPLLDSLGGQAVWLLPWIWLPLLLALLGALRKGPHAPRHWLLACLAVGPVFGFTFLTALGSRGLPHWQAPGYAFVLPLLGAWLDDRLRLGDAWASRWLKASIVGFVVALAALGAHARTGWLAGPLPVLREEGDPTADMVDWSPLVPRLRAWGWPRPGLHVAGVRWDDAAKLAYALGPREQVWCVGPDPRGFHFVAGAEKILGEDVLLVVRRRPGPEPLTLYRPLFDRLVPLGIVPLRRDGEAAAAVAIGVYRGERLRRLAAPERPL